MKLRLFQIVACTAFLWSCSVQKQVQKSAQQYVLNDAALQTAHVGISVYEPATNKYWFNYQGDKYFVPASNTKIPTCYAAMKYLGDSLVGARFFISDTIVYLIGSADPTFLHSDYLNQPVFSFLKRLNKPVGILQNDFQETALGSGWSWDDYLSTYMAERSFLPMYGNTVKFYLENGIVKSAPSLFSEKISQPKQGLKGFAINRSRDNNDFNIDNGKNKEIEVTYSTLPYNSFNGLALLASLLQDTLHLAIKGYGFDFSKRNYSVIHSQPTDSLLKPMMHRSDNFFAEQSLLMVSNELLGSMNDAKIIDTILKTDFKDLPQKPRWVDGSGLSRYNLFTPQDLVAILNKMRNEFGMERIKNIFATGNTGTLTNYYKKDSTFIYAKTGTLSGVVALSGFLYTQKGKLLIFSVLVNNHQASATAVRRAVEKFIEGIRERY